MRSVVRLTIKLREPARYQLKRDKNLLYLIFDPPKAPIDVLAEMEREAEELAKREGGTAVYKHSAHKK